jgi:DNA polymerase-1
MGAEMQSAGQTGSARAERDGRDAVARDVLMLVDGHALVHRAYHAIPPNFMTSRGEPTNAVFGFTSMLLTVLQELEPEYCAVTFDRSAPTFRHTAYADYKGTRPRMSDDLRQQFQRVRQVVRALNVPIFELDGFEADDLLGCLARQAEQAGVDTVIVTGDLDTLQLVDDHVSVLAPRGRISDTVRYDVAAVRERFGLDPAQVPDLKALSGDTSDNIKGVPGIGPKTASTLLGKFGTVENLFAHLDEVPAKQRDLLAAHEQQVRQNKELVTIDRDAPCVLDLTKCRLTDYNRQKALSLFQELEFRSLLGKLPRADGDLEEIAPAAAEQMALFSDLTGANPPADVAVAEAPPSAIQSPEQLTLMVADLRRAGGFTLLPAAHQRTEIDFDLAGFALAVDSEHAWYVPVAAGESALTELGVLNVLRPVLEDEQIQKTAHNAKLLYTMLDARGVHLRGLRFDTMIAAYLLNPSSRVNTVKDLVFQQMGREVEGIGDLAGKGGSILDVAVERIAPVAILEAQLLGQIAKELRGDLEVRAQLELFDTVELPLIPVLSGMEQAGIKVDVQVLGAMAREMAEQIRQVELDIYNSVGHQFTINSPQQLGKVLVEELHLPITKRTKTGYSTDAQVLDELRGAHPVVDLVLTYRNLTKLKSTYIDALPALINPRTGRVHTTFNQAVASTGRLSSDSPNLQNIPARTELGRQIRRSFVAGEPDSVLFAADYSQIELRIAAHITRDPLLIKAFMEDADVHAATAASVFSVPLDKVTAEQRGRAKTVNFAILYGISDFGLSQRLRISRSEADFLISSYLARHAGVRQYIEETLTQARERGYVETPLGRRRYLPELRSSNQAVRAAGERMAINMPIQGAQADLIKLAMIAVDRELNERKLRTRMLLQVHDELVFEVPREELAEVAQLVKERMEGAMQLIVPIKVEMKVGEDWYDMSPYAGAA